MEEDLDPLDRQLASSLFKRQAVPSSAETETFVRRVMGRVEAESAWTAGALALLQRRWLAPTLATGLAALLFSIAGADAPQDLLADASFDEPGMSETLLSLPAEAP